MFYCTVKKGGYVFKQGDMASCFFIIEKGLVGLLIDGEKKKEMSRQQSFGELALLYNAPRSATIVAQEDTYFWAIDRKTIRQVGPSDFRSLTMSAVSNFKRIVPFWRKYNSFSR